MIMARQDSVALMYEATIKGLRTEVEHLQSENANLIAAIKGFTFSHNNDAVMEELGKLRHEREQLLLELQRRKDSQHQHFLEFRGIAPEYGAAVCKQCQGSGVKAYASTSAWRGGIGGQAITSAICDGCWGSGDTNNPWTDLRKLAAENAAWRNR